MSDTEAIIKHLHEILDKEKNLAEVLQRSLVKAREVAQADLRPDLFDALEWPQNLEEYEAYLSRFVRWVPRQADSRPWQRLAADERHAKEVSDRMSHFFWLVDQKVDDDDGAVPQSFDVFKEMAERVRSAVGELPGHDGIVQPQKRCSRSLTTLPSAASMNR